MAVEMGPALFTVSVAITGDHVHEVATARREHLGSCSIAVGPGDRRPLRGLHPFRSFPRLLQPSGSTSRNRRFTHGRVSGRSTKVSRGAIDGSATESFYLRSRATGSLTSGSQGAGSSARLTDLPLRLGARSFQLSFFDERDTVYSTVWNL